MGEKKEVSQVLKPPGITYHSFIIFIVLRLAKKISGPTKHKQILIIRILTLVSDKLKMHLSYIEIKLIRQLNMHRTGNVMAPETFAQWKTGRWHPVNWEKSLPHNSKSN